MKPTAVLVAVMFLLRGILFVGCSFNTEKKAGTATHGSELILPEVSLKKEIAAPLPRSPYKKEALPTETKSKLVKPHFHKIDVKGDSSPYCGAQPMREENDISGSIIT